MTSARLSHVLHWVLPYRDGSGRDGWWVLQCLADYEAGRPQKDPALIFPVSRDAGPDLLTQFASAMLGCPVTLTRSDQEIRRRRPSSRWHVEPRYYVTSPPA